VDVVGIGGGYLLVLMIETPRPVHTHGRSSFIYINGFSTLNSGYGGHNDVAPALYLLSGT